MGYFYNKYLKEIENDWYWDKIKKESLSNCYIDEEDNIVASCLLGSVFSLYPSGKYWTWWACSNVDVREQIKDRAFWDALNEVFENHGYWIASGEGDPCDLFAQFIVDIDEVEKLSCIFTVQEDFEKYEKLLEETE